MNIAQLRVPVVPSVWRGPLLVWLVSALLVLTLYRDTALAMFLIWERSETYAHAFVVPPLALWVVWRLRGQLAGLQVRPAPAAVLLLLALAVGWEVGALAQVAALQHFMLVGMLVATVPVVLGWQVANALAFPLGFLFFAVPFGEFLTPWLINYTADFTVTAIRWSGIPVFREGNQFVIPSGRWSVVEACSGIRYLMASLMVGTLFAYLNYSTLRRRWAFVGVAIVTPIVANWLRAYMIVMIGHLSNNRLATGVDHIVYGWVFFGIVIAAMFMVGARWTDAQDPPVASLSGLSALRPVPGSALWIGLAGVVVALAGVHAGARHWLERGESLSAGELLVWPQEWLDGWRPDPASPIPLVPVFRGASAELQQALTRGDGRVWVTVAHYAHQDEQRKMVSSVNTLVSSMDPVWNLLSSGVQQHGLPVGLPAVRVARVGTAGLEPGALQKKLLVWQFFWVDGRALQGDAQAKLWQAWQALRGRGSAATAVVIYTDDLGDGTAERRLSAFLQANFTPLVGWLVGQGG